MESLITNEIVTIIAKIERTTSVILCYNLKLQISCANLFIGQYLSKYETMAKLRVSCIVTSKYNLIIEEPTTLKNLQTV